jgi:hypothetical protein
MGTDVWLTPRYILDALGPFDLDPCAAPAPEQWPTADRHITLPTDGLTAPWSGRVWCNPPYGNQTWLWLDKLAEHGQGTALIFARTETAGFARQVWQMADAILFLQGRIRFHRADGQAGVYTSGAPSCLVAYGERDATKLRRCGLPGAFIRLTPTAVTTPTLDFGTGA